MTGKGGRQAGVWSGVTCKQGRQEGKVAGPLKKPREDDVAVAGSGATGKRMTG